MRYNSFYSSHSTSSIIRKFRYRFPNFIHIGILLISSLSYISTSVYADEPSLGVIGVKNEGTKLTRRRFINFIGTGVTAADNSATATTDVTIPSSAPTDATYITQTANATLTAEQALGALATGYMKSATTTGVITTQAVPIPVADGGTGVATLAANGVLYGNGTGAALVTAQGGTNTILTASAGAPSFSATPIINTSAQLGVASTTTGSLKLGHALSANLTTLQAGNATAAVTYVLPTADGTNTQQLTTNGSGVLSWTAQGSGTALSSITAATAANTIANGTNTGQVWNWAPTADSVNAFTFGETTAATGGTSTLGVPNQVLLRSNTLASSTMSPLAVYSRGSHVFSVSPSARQILATDGTASVPPYSFASDATLGMFASGQQLSVNAPSSFAVFINGLNLFEFQSTRVLGPNGTASTPVYTNAALATSGPFFPTSAYGIAVVSIENSRFIDGAFQFSKGTADAVSYAINSRKARGSVASPTVITTGDDLLTENGYGYVGATNTYVQATQILHDSTGTIADTTTGIGGQIKMLTRTVGKALVNRVILNGNVDLTENVAATIVTIPLASLEMAGGTVVYSIDASDGTDMVSVSGQVDFAAVNKGGVYTTNSNVIGTEAIANSDPTINVITTFGFSNGVNQTSFQITSSMTRVPTAFTTTTRRCTYQVISGAQQSVTAP